MDARAEGEGRERRGIRMREGEGWVGSGREQGRESGSGRKRDTHKEQEEPSVEQDGSMHLMHLMRSETSCAREQQESVTVKECKHAALTPSLHQYMCTRMHVS